jgi:hypothetical protein
MRLKDSQYPKWGWNVQTSVDEDVDYHKIIFMKLEIRNSTWDADDNSKKPL